MQTENYGLTGLQAGMGTRHEPTAPSVRLRKVKVGNVPNEWVLAPGADPDGWLLWLQGSGSASGLEANQLPLAAGNLPGSGIC